MARDLRCKDERPLSVLIDLFGPKIRTVRLQNHQPVNLEADQLNSSSHRAKSTGDNTRSRRTTTGMARRRGIRARHPALDERGAIELLVETAQPKPTRL